MRSISQQHLKSYRGMLQADAYAGFQQLYEGGRIIEAACRVGEDVATLTPHRSGRAGFPHVRFLTEELRSQRRNGGRSLLKEEDDASTVHADEPTRTSLVDHVWRATSAISSRPGAHTIAIDGHCL